EDHADSCGDDHARDKGFPSGVRRQFLFEKSLEPGRRTGRLRHILGDGGHTQCLRIMTTAVWPIRKRSGGGSCTRTRTGYRDARITQLSVRCKSGRPSPKRPMTPGSGATPKPTLSTTPEKRTFGFSIK